MFDVKIEEFFQMNRNVCGYAYAFNLTPNRFAEVHLIKEEG